MSEEKKTKPAKKTSKTAKKITKPAKKTSKSSKKTTKSTQKPSESSKKTTKTGESLIKKHGIVVMLDALGVRDYNQHEAEIYMHHKNELIKIIEEKSNDAHLVFTEKTMAAAGLLMFLLKGLDSRFNFSLEDIRIEKPGVIAFGDTLIIYWHVLESYLPVALWYLPAIIGDVIPYGINNDILWRGSIGAGEYYIDNENSNIILGPAVKDAISWYDMANWVGVIASPKCGYIYDSVVNIPGRKEPSPIVKYQVPLKDGSKKEMYALNWVKNYCESNSLLKFSDKPIDSSTANLLGKVMFSLKFGDYSITRAVSEKYENTHIYFEWCMHYNNQFTSN